MSNVLRKFIAEVIKEQNDPRVPSQLVPRDNSGKDTSKTSNDHDDKEGVDEMSTTGAIAGYTAPLGASSEDVGQDPTKPGQKLKKRKADFVRWK